MASTFRELKQLPTARTPTPNQRAGILVWDVGFKTSGPHSHRNAGELFYFFHGRCRMIAGPVDRVIGPHTIVWLHPEAPHQFEVVGGEPVAMFLIVSCNQLPSHIPPEDFIPGAEKIGMDVLSAKPGSKYSFEPFLRTEVVRIDPGGVYRVEAEQGHETVTFVIRGEPYVTVGPLSGTYPTYGELFVPPGRAQKFENRTHSPVDLLVSRVRDDPGRPCIDTPFERGEIAKRFKPPMPLLK